MPRPDSIFSRLLAAMLVLLVAAFPAAASGTAGHCAVEHADAGPDAVQACCPAHEAGADPEDSDPVPSEQGCCGKCMHACCRTADVVHARPAVTFDRTCLAPVLMPIALALDPVAREAIFHPPRA